jgi:hypothetical protein
MGTMFLRLDKDLVFRVGSTKVVTFIHTAAKALSVQTASTFNGEAMDITKAGTGAGTALKIANSGTGASLVIRSATTDVAKINPDGEFEHLTSGKGIILKSPNGTRFRITVADNGTLSATSI